MFKKLRRAVSKLIKDPDTQQAIIKWFYENVLRKKKKTDNPPSSDLKDNGRID
jgi:hypothetical protein